MSDLTPEQIERVRLEAEVANLRAYVQPFPTAEHIAAHRRRIAELEERIRKLPPVPREPKPPRLPG